MKIERSFVIGESIGKVWDFFMDVRALSSCLPGCEQIETKDERTYVVNLRLKVAYVPINFRVRFDIIDINPPYFIRTIGRGEDDKKLNIVRLENLFLLKKVELNRTEISYDVNVTIQGPLGKFAYPIFREKMTQLGNVFEENVKKIFSSLS
jgi:carbon monoxide dehydrogenase subunit G